ncbi:helix-turn-helix domain-containing protein, partial [Halomonas sp. BC2]
SLEEVEKRYIRKVLEATGGNKRRTAEVLGIARRTLYRRLEDSDE